MSRQRATVMIEAVLRKQRLERRFAVQIQCEMLRGPLWFAEWTDSEGCPCGFSAPDLAGLCDRLEALTDEASGVPYGLQP